MSQTDDISKTSIRSGTSSTRDHRHMTAIPQGNLEVHFDISLSLGEDTIGAHNYEVSRRIYDILEIQQFIWKRGDPCRPFCSTSWCF